MYGDSHCTALKDLEAVDSQTGRMFAQSQDECQVELSNTIKLASKLCAVWEITDGADPGCGARSL